ncbi:uncharacterized protein SCHCODRAFT_02644193 [Schizophyllum commune H4-8]|uniref:uncharacterized protein n=1 Tax=Schizophyllum commune (strain H4-8 / FGSC 9210) TaxID=578458 RepID=UPI00215E3B47|nr:uncharacterized protein SCHCODRAFT_02644193 [Schizophyllum commune H4-8]KAI5885236.1 hypothetical protein SCHCODRAFT_02644193 [Schizophyllum commune H4-8]
MAFRVRRDLDTLRALLKETDPLVGVAPSDTSPRVEANIRQCIQIVRDRGSLHTVFAGQLPSPGSYGDFVSQYRVRNSPIINVYDAIYCVIFLGKLSYKLKRPELCQFDADLFLSALVWIEYLLPLRYGPWLQNTSRDVRDWVLFDLTRACMAFLQEFLLNTRSDVLLQVLHSEDERATAVLIAFWLDWARLRDIDRTMSDADESETIIRGLLLLATHYTSARIDGAARDKVTFEILRATHDRPRSFFRRYGVHLQLMLADSRLRDDRVSMGTVLRGLLQLSHAPALAVTHMPTKLILELIACARYYHRPGTTSQTWALSLALLADGCTSSHRCMIFALQHNMLMCAVDAQAAPKGTDLQHDATRLLDAMSSVAQTRSPRAILAFHRAEDLARSAGVNYDIACKDQRLKAILRLFGYEYGVLQELGSVRELVTRCCNVECPSAAIDPPVALRACACGEALYCSRTCQRAHWTTGKHCELCPARYPEKHGRLTTKLVCRMVAEAKYNLRLAYALLPDPASRPLVHLALELPKSGIPTFTFRRVPEDEQPEAGHPLGAIVDVNFALDGPDSKRTRRIWFIAKRRAGDMRLSFRVLTDEILDF